MNASNKLRRNKKTKTILEGEEGEYMRVGTHGDGRRENNTREAN